MRKILLTLAVVIVIGHAESRDGPTYQSLNGCDVGRWAEWDLILEELRGWPVEQADARYVRDANRRICEAWEAGRLPEDEANEAYQNVLDAWGRRMEERQRAKETNGRETVAIGYSFQDDHGELRELETGDFGPSAQTSDYRRKARDRFHLPFQLLNDSELELKSWYD